MLDQGPKRRVLHIQATDFMSEMLNSFKGDAENGRHVHSVVKSQIRHRLKIKNIKTIFLPVVLYGCEIWSLTLREH
jgi:hypothetical protein